MRIDDQSQAVGQAGGVYNESGKGWRYLVLPNGVIAYVASVEMWNEIEHPVAPFVERVDRMQ